MSRRISSDRKFAYYLGGALIAIGLLLFLSVFVTGALNFGNFDDFDGQARSSGIRAIGGMILMMVGGFVRTVGARGAAGSGLVLDPERARRDLEPFSRQGGGMLKDALDEADIALGSARDHEPLVMIRCRACSTLNEEDSKFCQECGQPV
ncbi:hypothetical protein Pla163_36920 [Planctomycetes bacterium Pla163]|uniref:Zinc-ribbon domain-containing protein n=1 Tax=Rohdeia mirabilis TaxID=2528008 RepID=A0A518D4Z4_9BACT|nr:hypothetical protein Pla163_36920 [Planctomycetes bacterium Pla163]